MRRSLHLRVGPAVFRIGSAWRAPLAALERLYGDYPRGTDLIADFTVRLQAVRPWRRYVRPSILIAGDHMLADAAPMALAHGLLAAEMGMNLQMALGWRRHLLLHAAAVERGGRVLLLSGESGSGKSTLAALLSERGWRLLGDEFALIDPADGSAVPFPRLVSIKNAAIDVVRAVAGDARMGPLLADTPKGAIRHLVPRPDHVAAMDRAAMPALLLFPRFGEAQAALPVAPAEAFVRLTHASTNYVALGEAGFTTLTRLVESVPAAAFHYPDSATGIAMVEALWREAGA